MNRLVPSVLTLSLMAQLVHAQAALPTTCIVATATAQGNEWWQEVKLNLTNNCPQDLDFQNAIVRFKSKANLTNANFWGQYSPLSYPDNNLVINSEKQADGTYLSTLSLHFPMDNATSNIFPKGRSIMIQFGGKDAEVLSNSTNVYLQSTVPIATGELVLDNVGAKPSGVSQAYALAHIRLNNSLVKDVQLPWASKTSVKSLTAGSYALSVDSIVDSSGNKYNPFVDPDTISVLKDKSVTAKLTFTKIDKFGGITFTLDPLPTQISAYTSKPTIQLVSPDGGATVNKTLTWGSSTTFSDLNNGMVYNFSAPVINFNGQKCSPSFNPATTTAATTSPAVKVSYTCTPVVQVSETISVRGAPTTLSSLKVTVFPSDQSSPISQTIALTNGSGAGVFQLVQGGIYTIETDTVNGYDKTFSTHPFSATANGQVSINYAKSVDTGGRIIAYVAGWKPAPSAQELKDAGYTHVLIAFGVFSTKVPGLIVPVFEQITPSYIQSLHAANIKVLLSLGGALTSAVDTTVDFHEALNITSSPDDFKAGFIKSYADLQKTYGFDGFDVDIEHGLNAGGTFINPQGDIQVLADIINTMYTNNPGILISMAPQTANISPNSGFDATWGNYASLIMQTSKSLAWVGIQLYNTGCCWSINKDICYAQNDQPNFSVAMGTGLLENWPEKNSAGQLTGFMSYVSSLKPSQIVLGYPAPASDGSSDGGTVVSNANIIKAVNCLKTAKPADCGSYLPPRAYGNIGGVFEWEASYDQNNGYKFAKELKCVVRGICN